MTNAMLARAWVQSRDACKDGFMDTDAMLARSFDGSLAAPALD